MIKYIVVLWTALLSAGTCLRLEAQALLPAGVIERILPSRELSVGWNKTCLLIFPEAVQSADRGSADLLAERVTGAENALKVKAARPDFAPTSLTVVTTGGQVFSFGVSYAARPPYLVLDCRPGGSDRGLVRFKEATSSLAEWRQAVIQAEEAAAFIRHVRRSGHGLKFKLEGIYIKKDLLFFRFRLQNLSNIPYRLASLRLFMRDLTTGRRTAMQDNELKPLYMMAAGCPEKGDGQVVVMAVPRFTLADHKRVAIVLTEQQGDRSVRLWLKDRNLRKTKRLGYAQEDPGMDGFERVGSQPWRPVH